MKTRGIVRVRALHRSDEFSGPGVKDAMNTLGVPHMRERFGKGWVCRSDHGADVQALLESRGYRIEAIF